MSRNVKGKMAKQKFFLLLRQYQVSRFENIYTISGGYAGDMDEDLCNELLDDIDFHYNKVKCRRIEQLVPQLMRMADTMPSVL